MMGQNDPKGPTMRSLTVRRALAVVAAALCAAVPAASSASPSGENGWLSAGRAHTCLVTDGGGVECRGDNSDGQLGDGTRTSSNVPVSVQG